MARKATGWTCSRQANSTPCRHHNPPRKRNCQKCGKPRPSRKRPAHMAALDLDYAAYIALNGGERCGICGKEPEGRKLDRDHDHKTGEPRGLLCWSCNRQLRTWATIEWLTAAAEYLNRADERAHLERPTP